MTDARFPERWLNDRRIMRLDPIDFRSFIVALAYAVANRTDGRLDTSDLEACPGFNLNSIAPLVAATLWVERDAGVWMIAGFGDTQTTRAQLDAAAHARALTRERVARHRARKDGEPVTRYVTRYGDISADGEPVTRYVRRYVTRESTRPGQDRPGPSISPSVELTSPPTPPTPTGPEPAPRHDGGRGRDGNIQYVMSAYRVSADIARDVVTRCEADPTTRYSAAGRLRQEEYTRRLIADVTREHREREAEHAPRCEDHPTYPATGCSCCHADVKAGQRPREYIGRHYDPYEHRGASIRDLPEDMFAGYDR